MGSSPTWFSNIYREVIVIEQTQIEIKASTSKLSEAFKKISSFLDKENRGLSYLSTRDKIKSELKSCLSEEQDLSVIIKITELFDSKFEFRQLTKCHNLSICGQSIAQIVLHSDRDYSIIINNKQVITGQGTVEQAKKVCVEYIKQTLYDKIY